MLSNFFALLQSAPGSSPSPIATFLPILVVFAIFYLLVFMPMQKQRKQHAKMIKELQNGNTVVTNGGIVGSVVAINEDDTLILRVKPDNIKIQVARSAVSTVVPEAKK